MRYFLIIFLLFIGCSNKKEDKKVYIKDITHTNDTKNYNSIIKIDDLNFTKQNKIYIYSFNKNKILLFINNNKYSKLQIKQLKELKYKFYIIKNQNLIKFFKIKKYPTILITKDNANIKRYEGFIPNEILKYEIKD